MTADKRQVATDALDTLGSLIGPDEKRDAIHLAVEPVVAVEDLQPGDHVGLVDGGAGRCDHPVGIVDPFLEYPVRAGERFWLVVYPRQINSLRHVWEHPAFPASGETNVTRPRKAASEQWLRDFIARADCPGYDEVIKAALDHPNNSWNSDYLSFYGSDAHGEIPPAFWDHLEIVTGQKIPKEARAEWFSCSC